MNTDQQVVISGAGLVSSLGRNADRTWQALLDGKCGICSISTFDATGFDCRVAAQTEGFDPEGLGIHPRDSRIMDTHSFMLLMAGREAFRDAGLDSEVVPGEEIGFFAGMGMVDYNIEDLLPAVLKSRGPEGELNYRMFYTEEFREIYPLWPLSMLNNITFCQVGIDLGIRGENAVFCPHADSGAQAITEGVRTVLEGRARVTLAGGVSEKVSPLSLARGHLAGTLKPSSNVPEDCCLFGEGEKGTVMGEGSGIVSLELRSSADIRGSSYTVMITGYGHACEPMDEGQAPTAAAIANAMGQALEASALHPDDIDLIIAHFDGTPSGDRNEKEAINTIFKGRSKTVPVFSSKAALGHLLAAAPAVDIILGMHMIEKGIIPAAIPDGHGQEIEGVRLIRGVPLKQKVRRVMVNCRSYEGQCASIIIEAV